jgi:hypothetical protein
MVRLPSHSWLLNMPASHTAAPPVVVLPQYTANCPHYDSELLVVTCVDLCKVVVTVELLANTWVLLYVELTSRGSLCIVPLGTYCSTCCSMQ